MSKLGKGILFDMHAMQTHSTYSLQQAWAVLGKVTNHKDLKSFGVHGWCCSLKCCHIGLYAVKASNLMFPYFQVVLVLLCSAIVYLCGGLFAWLHVHFAWACWPNPFVELWPPQRSLHYLLVAQMAASAYIASIHSGVQSPLFGEFTKGSCPYLECHKNVNP